MDSKQERVSPRPWSMQHGYMLDAGGDCVRMSVVNARLQALENIATMFRRSWQHGIRHDPPTREQAERALADLDATED